MVYARFPQDNHYPLVRPAHASVTLCGLPPKGRAAGREAHPGCRRHPRAAAAQLRAVRAVQQGARAAHPRPATEKAPPDLSRATLARSCLIAIPSHHLSRVAQGAKLSQVRRANTTRSQHCPRQLQYNQPLLTQLTDKRVRRRVRRAALPKELSSIP
jgi:hypothetical protein